MVWLRISNHILWLVLSACIMPKDGWCGDLRQFEYSLREQYSQAAGSCDSSYGLGLGQFEVLAESMRKSINQARLTDAQLLYYDSQFILGDSTTLASLEYSIIPKLRLLADAESHYLAAAGVVSLCDRNWNSVSDVVFEACRNADFELVTKLLVSIDSASMLLDAMQGIDSLPEDDRYLESEWRYEEDEYGDLRTSLRFGATVTLDQLNAIKSHGERVTAGHLRLKFLYQMLNLDLAFGFLDSARSLVATLETYEPSFFKPVDSQSVDSRTITESFVWSVKEADWEALYQYYGELQYAYWKLGRRDQMIRSTRLAIIATDRGPYRDAIPNFYNGWFDGAVELGIYEDITDLVTKFCYQDRCQSKIASQEADSGRFDSALEHAQMINDGFWKTEALEHLARRLHKAGNDAAAREMIYLSLESSLGESPECRTVYSGDDFSRCAAANDFVDLGLFDDAFELIRSIGDVNTRTESVDYAVSRLRKLGQTEKADSIENVIVAALSAIPDSLRFAQSNDVLLNSLLKSDSLQKAESLIVPGPMVPYSQLVLAFGLKGDTVSVLRALGNYDYEYQQASAIADCLENCVALSDTVHAGLFFEVFKRVVSVHRVDHYLGEWDCGVSAALLAATELGNAEFVRWISSADNSSGLRYAAMRCLAAISAKSGKLIESHAQIDSAYEMLEVADKENDLRGLELAAEADSLLAIEERAFGRKASLERLHELSLKQNASRATCQALAGFVRRGVPMVNRDDLDERRMLHELIEVYAQGCLFR